MSSSYDILIGLLQAQRNRGDLRITSASSCKTKCGATLLRESKAYEGLCVTDVNHVKSRVRGCAPWSNREVYKRLYSIGN